MKPVRTEKTETVYRGPTPEVGDLWCHRVEPGVIESFWEPNGIERQIIAEGGRIRLEIFHEPIPPVSVNVIRPEDSEPVGKHPFKVDEKAES